MNSKPCSRLWEVEAARDGRLSTNDLANALRHRAHCAECTREEQALAALGQRIAQSSRPPIDDVSLRRTRQRLLARWNERVLAHPSTSARKRWIGVGVLAAAALALSLFFWRPRTPPPPLVQINAKDGASFSERRTATAYRVALRDGVARFTVRSHDEHAVIIDLPDGTIEDRGTVFEVEVRDLHTERVSVETGRVFVRLNGRASFELSAGQSWRVPAPPAAPPLEAPTVQPLLKSNAAPRVSAHVSHKAPSSASAPVSTPAARSAPDTAEDDAYLHIVDLLRNGHTAQASAQAKQYLVRFPNGFRRPEVADIVRRTEPRSQDPQ